MQRKILLVDDDAYTCTQLRKLLESDELSVDAVSNGQEALAKLIGQEQDFSVLITDLRMPGMGGMDLIREVSKRRLLVTTIVTTAFGSIDRVVEVWRESGAEALDRADYAKAEECLNKALGLGGDDAETYRLLGRTARRQGRFDDAAAFLNNSLRLGGSPEPIALEEQLARLEQGDLGAESVLAAYVAASHPEAREILAALARG